MPEKGPYIDAAHLPLCITITPEEQAVADEVLEKLAAATGGNLNSSEEEAVIDQLEEALGVEPGAELTTKVMGTVYGIGGFFLHSGQDAESIIKNVADISDGFPDSPRLVAIFAINFSRLRRPDLSFLLRQTGRVDNAKLIDKAVAHEAIAHAALAAAMAGTQNPQEQLALAQERQEEISSAKIRQNTRGVIKTLGNKPKQHI